MSAICENPSACFTALNMFAAQRAAAFSATAQHWAEAVADAAAASKTDFVAGGADAVQWLTATSAWAKDSWATGSVWAQDAWTTLTLPQMVAVLFVADLMLVGLWRLFTAGCGRERARVQGQQKTVAFDLNKDDGLRRSHRQRTSFVPWSPPIAAPKPSAKMARGNGKPVRLNGLNNGQMLYHDVKTTKGVYDTRSAVYTDGFVRCKGTKMTLHAFAVQHMRDLIATGEYTGKPSCTIYQRPSAHGLYAKSKKGAKVPISNFC